LGNSRFEWTSKGSGFLLGCGLLIFLVLVGKWGWFFLGEIFRGEWGAGFILLMILPFYYVVLMEFAKRTRFLIDSKNGKVSRTEEFLFIPVSWQEFSLSDFSEVRVRLFPDPEGEPSFGLLLSGEKAVFTLEFEGMKEDYLTARKLGEKVARLAGLSLADELRAREEGARKIEGELKEAILKKLTGLVRYENSFSENWKGLSCGEVFGTILYFFFLAPVLIFSGFNCVTEAFGKLTIPPDLSVLGNLMFGLLPMFLGSFLIMIFLQSTFGSVGFTLDPASGNACSWKAFLGIPWSWKTTRIGEFDRLVIESKMTGRKERRRVFLISLSGEGKRFLLRQFESSAEALCISGEIGVFLDIPIVDLDNSTGRKEPSETCY